MDSVLHIQLLGAPRITLDQRPVTFRRRKALATLCYLALTGGAVARETLANLLAGESEQHLAFQNVRNTVADLREQLGAHLLIDRKTVAMNHTLAYWLDVAELEQVLARGDYANEQTTQQLITLYRGDLLDGFDLRNASVFTLWLEAERKRLRDMVVQAWQVQLEHLAGKQDVGPALMLVERIIAIDPLAEATYRTAMLLLEQIGQPERALELYQRCHTTFTEQLGVVPAPVTTAIYTRLRERHALAAEMAHSPIPIDADLSLLSERLANPACRLMTLLAPHQGSATALALRAVAYYTLPSTLQHSLLFSDGVYITSLEESQREPKMLSALLESVHDRAMLLVLDNLTPTQAEIETVAEILRRTRRVTLLVVARARLFLREEWVFDIA